MKLRDMSNEELKDKRTFLHGKSQVLRKQLEPILDEREEIYRKIQDLSADIDCIDSRVEYINDKIRANSLEAKRINKCLRDRTK